MRLRKFRRSRNQEACASQENYAGCEGDASGEQAEDCWRS